MLDMRLERFFVIFRINSGYSVAKTAHAPKFLQIYYILRPLSILFILNSPKISITTQKIMTKLFYLAMVSFDNFAYT